MYQKPCRGFVIFYYRKTKKDGYTVLVYPLAIVGEGVLDVPKYCYIWYVGADACISPIKKKYPHGAMWASPPYNYFMLFTT